MQKGDYTESLWLSYNLFSSTLGLPKTGSQFARQSLAWRQRKTPSNNEDHYVLIQILIKAKRLLLD